GVGRQFGSHVCIVAWTAGLHNLPRGLTQLPACVTISPALSPRQRGCGEERGSRFPIAEKHTMLLTKHEGETFRNQTVYISGQAFIRCNFVACTLVLRETVYHLEGCTFERCNWHVDWVL